MTAQWLLAQARDLMARPDAATVGRWPRATALLARQALETRIDEVYAEREPSLVGVSARAKLLCLPRYVDADVAHEASYVWSALSNACHEHAYELPPTTEELGRLLDMVERLVTP